MLVKMVCDDKDGCTRGRGRVHQEKDATDSAGDLLRALGVSPEDGCCRRRAAKACPS